MPSHPKQSISTSNKPSPSVMKLKQKNKRRNRKKKKQRIHYPIHEMQKMSNANCTNSIYNTASSTDANSATQNQMATSVAQMWAKTYESMIRLQFQHRTQFWKSLAINRKTEICELRKKLGNNCKYFGEEETVVDKGVDSTSQDEDSEESESYLKFLEITLRHRQERKHDREEEADDSVD